MPCPPRHHRRHHRHRHRHHRRHHHHHHCRHHCPHPAPGPGYMELLSSSSCGRQRQRLRRRQQGSRGRWGSRLWQPGLARGRERGHDAHVCQQLVQVPVGRRLLLLLRELLHADVEAEVEPRQLLLHLPHVLQLLEGALLPCTHGWEPSRPTSPGSPQVPSPLPRSPSPSPKACSFPEWKSLRRLSSPPSISQTSETSVRKLCCSGAPRAAPAPPARTRSLLVLRGEQRGRYRPEPARSLRRRGRWSPPTHAGTDRLSRARCLGEGRVGSGSTKDVLLLGGSGRGAPAGVGWARQALGLRFFLRSSMLNSVGGTVATGQGSCAGRTQLLAAPSLRRASRPRRGHACPEPVRIGVPPREQRRGGATPPASACGTTEGPRDPQHGGGVPATGEPQRGSAGCTTAVRRRQGWSQ